jgi:hypothetical protein
LTVSLGFAAILQQGTGIQRAASMERRHRKAPRRDLTYQVWIAYGSAEERIVPCTIANISESGARLCLPFNGDVPDDFRLMLSQRGRAHRRCKVAWRSAVEIGVSFVLPPPKAKKPPGRPDGF